MSRSKRNRKAKMARRQAQRQERFEAQLKTAHERLAQAREGARLRAEIEKTDAPQPVKDIIGAFVDPIGFAHDVLKRQMKRKESGT
jgi:hypothetical protein